MLCLVPLAGRWCMEIGSCRLLDESEEATPRFSTDIDRDFQLRGYARYIENLVVGRPLDVCREMNEIREMKALCKILCNSSLG